MNTVPALYQTKEGQVIEAPPATIFGGRGRPYTWWNDGQEVPVELVRERQNEPDLPQQSQVVSEVSNGHSSPTTLSQGSGNSSPAFVEKRGDELAGTEIETIETLPLLGKYGYVGQETSTLVSAYPKVGKTSLTTECIRDWAGLGHRILVFTEEPDIAWRLRFKDEAKPLWEGVAFVFAMNVDPKTLMGRMREGLEDIVVVDTARAVFGIRDENDNAEVSRKVSPWIAEARSQNKTLVVLHHANKAGGDHGRGISGGHALFASFDAALEIDRVPGSPRRRLIKGYARLLTPTDLIYERQEDGSLRALGDAADVTRDEVRERVQDALDAEYKSRKEIIAGLADPKPSYELVRSVLSDLVSDGRAERVPLEDKQGATYKWRKPQLPEASPIGGSSSNGSTIHFHPPCEICEEPCSFEDSEGRRIHPACATSPASAVKR